MAKIPGNRYLLCHPSDTSFFFALFNMHGIDKIRTIASDFTAKDKDI